MKYRIILTTTLAILGVLFFLGGPNGYSPRSLKSAWNLGHIFFFALLPLFVFSTSKFKKTKPAIQATWAIGTALLLGMAIEYLQYGFQRTPDTGDLFRNLIGAMVALLFLLPIKKTLSKPVRTTMQVITIVLCAAQFPSIITALVDEHQARTRFPVLADARTSHQIQRWLKTWKISIAKPPEATDDPAFKINLDTRRYSGVSLRHFPRNWQGCQYFQYRVFNPSAEDIKLTCRIHDKAHTEDKQRFRDRFNRSHIIHRGWNTVTISLEDVRQAPAGRQMDMEQIYAIGIFAERLPRPRTIYLDDLKLF